MGRGEHGIAQVAPQSGRDAGGAALYWCEASCFCRASTNAFNRSFSACRARFDSSSCCIRCIIRAHHTSKQSQKNTKVNKGKVLAS